SLQKMPPVTAILHINLGFAYADNTSENKGMFCVCCPKGIERPQQYTLPSLHKAIAQFPQHSKSIHLMLFGNLTWTGYHVSCVVPIPSCPQSLLPHAYNSPPRVNAIVCLQPMPIFLASKGFPVIGSHTSTGLVT